MNMNFFFSIYILAFTIAVWICIYIFVIRKSGKERRCSKCTTGQVIGWSNVKCGDYYLPKVLYIVDGKNYKTAGPRFRYVKSLSISTSFENIETKYETNVTTRENLPPYLEVKVRKNACVSLSESPLAKLYPAGTKVAVFYNPKKPKDAYVERFEGISKPFSILLFFMGIAMIALWIIFICIRPF